MMRKQFSFIIDQLSNVFYEIKHGDWEGVKSEIQLLLTGKTYRGKVKVIDTTFKKYKDYESTPGENVTILMEGFDGKKCSMHLGKDNPYNWMPKYIQAKLKARGELPPDHKIE